jgi:hypothetical protein
MLVRINAPVSSDTVKVSTTEHLDTILKYFGGSRERQLSAVENLILCDNLPLCSKNKSLIV